MDQIDSAGDTCSRTWLMIYYRDSMNKGMEGVYAISIMFILALLSVFVKEHVVVTNEGITGGYWIPLGNFIGYEMMHNALAWKDVFNIGIKHGDVDPNAIGRKAVFIEGKDKTIFIGAYASIHEKEWILNFILKMKESLEKIQKD